MENLNKHSTPLEQTFISFEKVP